MVELIHSAQSFMNAKDAIIAKGIRKMNELRLAICIIQSKVLDQRRPRREKRETGMVGMQDLPQDNTYTTHH